MYSYLSNILVFRQQVKYCVNPLDVVSLLEGQTDGYGEVVQIPEDKKHIISAKPFRAKLYKDTVLRALLIFVFLSILLRPFLSTAGQSLPIVCKILIYLTYLTL